MDSSKPSSSSFNRVLSLDVSQLDKINAIPNKTTDNILMDGLCLEDRHYMSALMDNDSSSDQDDEDGPPHSSAWSPMVQSPMIMNTRIKKLRPSYTITLSLEDISYIRPSWGISKGIRTIEIDKRHKRKMIGEQGEERKKVKTSGEGKPKADSNYTYFLLFLALLILCLTVPIYLHEKGKEFDRLMSSRIKVSHKSRIIEVYRPESGPLDTILRVHFAQGVPSNLKPAACSCQIYSQEIKRYFKGNFSFTNEPRASDCVACLDWAHRANLRVYVRRTSNDSYCYDLKWQSYDLLATPLVDCFLIGDEQWFGLGDLQTPITPLNKLQFDWTPLLANLSTESQVNSTQDADDKLPRGSLIDFSLFSTKGIHLGNLQTDFIVSISMAQDHQHGSKRICISAICTDKCTQSWLRPDHLDRLRYQNNILEYSICSAGNFKTLISNQFKLNQQKADVEKFKQNDESFNNNTYLTTNNTLTSNISSSLPEGIGLIDRTIFITSQEYMPILNGLTLRQHVDNIVKLGLKASSILLLDSRWELYVGSLKLNIQNFPKAKLLFEILHNKGFKIVFDIKAYMDTAIGVGNINQLHQAGRLYSFDTRKTILKHQDYIIRRKSLFKFENQTIELSSGTGEVPYLYRCKESLEGYCALIDVTKASNRNWMVGNILRSAPILSEADGLQIGGVYTESQTWSDHYKAGLSELVRQLMLKEKHFTLSQWTGDFGYIQLASRSCDWNSLKSVVNSVLNLGLIGHSLVHPGSVWGDLLTPNSVIQSEVKSTNRMDSIYGDVRPNERSEEELVVRWLQVSVFLPILQFNNISPIEKYGLQELVQNLTRIRRSHVLPELKKNLPYTPLIGNSRTNWSETRSPLLRLVWFPNQDSSETVALEQFTIGDDLLVAPILVENLRQRDIYLPNGIWRDELRQINLRGGKWLRNYPVELNEIAWFTRAKR